MELRALQASAPGFISSGTSEAKNPPPPQVRISEEGMSRFTVIIAQHL